MDVVRKQKLSYLRHQLSNIRSEVHELYVEEQKEFHNRAPVRDTDKSLREAQHTLYDLETIDKFLSDIDGTFRRFL